MKNKLTLGEMQLNVPDSFNAKYAEQLINGDFDQLLSFVVWKDTPQGFDYWNEQQNSGRLSPEAIAIIEQWLDGWTLQNELPRDVSIPKHLERYLNRSVKGTFITYRDEEHMLPIASMVCGVSEIKYAPWLGDSDNVRIWYWLNGDVSVGISYTMRGKFLKFSNKTQTRKQLEKQREIKLF